MTFAFADVEPNPGGPRITPFGPRFTASGYIRPVDRPTPTTSELPKPYVSVIEEPAIEEPAQHEYSTVLRRELPPLPTSSDSDSDTSVPVQSQSHRGENALGKRCIPIFSVIAIGLLVLAPFIWCAFLTSVHLTLAHQTREQNYQFRNQISQAQIHIAKTEADINMAIEQLELSEGQIQKLDENMDNLTINVFSFPQHSHANYSLHFSMWGLRQVEDGMGFVPADGVKIGFFEGRGMFASPQEGKVWLQAAGVYLIMVRVADLETGRKNYQHSTTTTETWVVLEGRRSVKLGTCKPAKGSNEASCSFMIPITERTAQITFRQPNEHFMYHCLRNEEKPAPGCIFHVTGIYLGPIDSLPRVSKHWGDVIPENGQ